MTMKENYIADTYDFSVPNVSELQKEFSTFKDNENESEKYLLVEVDATHGGYINKNYYYYTTEGQANGAASFITPFQKPILSQHIGDSTPIGRTVAAAFIPLSIPKGKENDFKTPKCKIRVKGVITDKKAIEHILTKRYFTVSTGGSSKNPPVCSICGSEIQSIGPFGSVSGCDHERGKTYEDDNGDKKQCYWKIGQMDYKEWSFVNMPADYTPEHVASVVSIGWVDTVDPQDSITLDVSSSLVDSEDPKNKNNKEENNNTNCKGGSPMADDKKNIELLDEFISALAVLDECEECDEEVDEKWEDEKDVKQVEEFDGDFVQVMNLFLAEDKVLPKSGSKERQAMKGTFCGPNKTFPIPDCKHAAVAIAMLQWPRIKEKYSSSVRARVTSCVRARAKTLNCKMSKKKDDSEVDVKVIQKEIESLKAQVVDFETKTQEKDGQIEAANKEIKGLKDNSKRMIAEKIVDLSMLAERQSITDVLNAENIDDRKNKYDAHVKSLVERTEDSLKDTIVDLTDELNIKINLEDKVNNPTVTTDNDKGKTNKKVVKKENEIRMERVSKYFKEK